MRHKAAKIACLGLVLCMAACFFMPVNALAAEAPPEVGAGAYVVMDAETGQVLVAKNAHLLGYPASITKIMTLALVLENIDLESEGDKLVRVSDAAIDALIPRASMIALQRGEEATVLDLLFATKIESANDAAHALGEYVAGSMDAFAQMMNEKARELGLSGSHFMNSSGQPDDNHYITAYDMAAITRWALTVPGFREIYGATRYSMSPTNLQPYGREFNNANMALVPYSNYYVDGVVGSKTGYTDQARYTLATTANRGGTELICIVLNCQFNDEKYTSTAALLNYCFENFRRVSYPVAQVPAATVPVYGGGQQALGDIDVFGEGEASFLLHNSIDEADIAVQLDVPEKYVMGQAFAPAATLSLPESCPQQQGGVLVSVPLTWRGLEQIVADNTQAGWERMAEEEPVLFWGIVAVPLLLAGLVVLRVVHVRNRRMKRRQQRLAAVRAQRPIRVAPRPQPGAAQPRTAAARRKPSTPALRVLYNSAASNPRRVGQAR